LYLRYEALIATEFIKGTLKTSGIVNDHCMLAQKLWFYKTHLKPVENSVGSPSLDI
jgi:hypothetical protein